MVEFVVGKNEKHTVKFSYDTFMGGVKIWIDEKLYTSSRVMFTGHTPFTFQVGTKEKHNVRIELDTPLFFALRGANVKVFIDEDLVQQVHVASNILKLAVLFGVLLLGLIIGFGFISYVENVLIPPF